MHKPLNFKPRPLALAVAFALGSSPHAAWAAAGRIQFAWGDVTVEQSGGNTVPLKRGDEIDAGDTIVTERGRAQIKFTDGSKVSLQPKTSFKVNEYSYDAKGGNADQQRNFMSLFRGGLRAISGAIGRSNRNSYRLTTPVGTIGIRGTEYLIMLDGSGAIVTVGDGAVALVNDAGEVVLVNGQTGRIVDSSSLPKVVKTKAVVPPPPKDLKDDPETGEPQQDDDDFQVSVSRDGGNPEQTLGNILADEFMSEETPPMEDAVEEVVEEVIVPKLESGSGFAVAFSFPAYGGPMGITDKDVNVDATFEEGRLTAWSGGTGPSDIGDLSLAGVSGSDQYIGWGRWSNTSGMQENFTVIGLAEGFTDQNESLHYVAGQPTDINALMNQGQTVANYAFQIATQPTDNFGNVGTFDSGIFQLDIAATPRVHGQLDATINGHSYDLTFFNVNATGGVFRDAGVSAFSGTGCSFGCNGAVAGLIAGPNADRAGVTYHIEDPANSQVISGAAVFTRDPNGPPVIFPQ